MRTRWIERARALAAVTLAAATAAGCGEFVRDQGRAPVQIVVEQLSAASGADPDSFSSTLQSDVITLVTDDPCSEENPCPTIYNDFGQVTMSLLPKDPDAAGAPSALNQVTFDRYRVQYRRTDGRNTPGVDVPHAFDSAITFTVPNDASASAGFQIVRHSAKQEPPLQPLGANNAIISTIAEVTFYGRDQAGNDVVASGSIGIDFGNFADPD